MKPAAGALIGFVVMYFVAAFLEVDLGWASGMMTTWTSVDRGMFLYLGVCSAGLGALIGYF